MSWTSEKVNETFDAFKQRVAEDEQFKAFALDKPSEAFEQLAGLELPAGVELIISEDKDGHHQLQVFVQPAAQTDEGELDEAELEQVAGGAAAFPVSSGQVIGGLAGQLGNLLPFSTYPGK